MPYLELLLLMLEKKYLSVVVGVMQGAYLWPTLLCSPTDYGCDKVIVII